MSGSLDWSIHIVKVAGGSAFQPWVPNSHPGDPTKAQVGDIVTWGNDTTGVHQPWPTENNTPTGAPAASNPPGSALFFSEPIPPGGSSTPQYVVPAALPSGTALVPGSVIYYCCKNHPTERGQIVIF
jgi:hypothetical protein